VNIGLQVIMHGVVMSLQKARNMHKYGSVTEE
jgi:hypothetical protein